MSNSIPIAVIKNFFEDSEQSKSLSFFVCFLFFPVSTELCTGATGYDFIIFECSSSYKVSANKDDLSPDRLDEANVLVFGGPRER